MPLPVQLRAVVDELEAVNDEWRAYINRKTGELASFSLDLLRSVENEESPSMRPDWERQLRQDCERVLEDPDFILLPSKFDIHEWSIMERFCRSLDDEAAGDRLLDAIHGRGAFRDDALKKIAAGFLKAHDIAYVDDSAAM